MSGTAMLLGQGIWVRSGPATLVVREKGWAVLVPGTRKEVIEAAWDLLAADPGEGGSDGPTGERFVEELARRAGLDGAAEISDLLFALVDGTSARIGVKGSTPLAVHGADGVELVAGTDGEPLALKDLRDVRRIAFGDLPAEDPLGALRVGTGIVRARGFVHALADPRALGEQERTALEEEVAAQGRSIEDPSARERRTAAPKPGRVTEGRPDGRQDSRQDSRQESSPVPAAEPSTMGSAQPGAPRRTAAVATRRSGEMPAASNRRTPADAPAAVGPSIFDGLFGPSPAEEPAAEEAVQTPPPAQPSSLPAARPAEDASSAPEEPPETDGAPGPAPRRRRLVSTSLFDRPRRAPQERPSTEGAPVPPLPSAPAPVAEPSSSDRPEPTGAPVQPISEAAPEKTDSSPVTLIEPVEESSADTLIEPLEVPAAAIEPRAGGSSPGTGSAGAPGAYDDLFGRTIHRSIEDAAVRRNPDDEPSDALDPPAHPGSAAEDVRLGQLAQQGPAPSDLANASSAEAASSAIGEDFIDWVPGVGRTAPEIARNDAVRVPPETPAVPASPAQSASPALSADPSVPAIGAPASRHAPVAAPRSASDGAVLLPGLLCPSGHAESPERTVCRVCRGPLQGPSRSVVRPPLGRIAVSTGGGFVLDRTAIVGRRPRASRVSGNDLPQLITVPSPQQDISRSHVELRLEGWHVVAIDLGTTNGTALLRPGADAVRLRPREGTVLVDGDRLDLGDGTILQYRESA